MASRNFFGVLFSIVLTAGLVLIGCDNGTTSGVDDGSGPVPDELVGKWDSSSISDYSVEFTKSKFKGSDAGTVWYDVRLTGKKIEYNMGQYGWFTWCTDYTLNSDNTEITFSGGESRSGPFVKQAGAGN
jgi:hypothetical protein